MIIKKVLSFVFLMVFIFTSNEISDNVFAGARDSLEKSLSIKIEI